MQVKESIILNKKKIIYLKESIILNKFFFSLKDRSLISLKESVLHLFYKQKGKFTPGSTILSFLRVSGSNYAYDMLNISFLTKLWK